MHRHSSSTNLNLGEGEGKAGVGDLRWRAEERKERKAKKAKDEEGVFSSQPLACPCLDSMDFLSSGG